MNRNRWITLGFLLSLALVTTPGLAQVRQLQGGNILDFNPQLGSGGYNQVIGGQGGVNSQLYVTGQVTGLRAFRGEVGYFAPNELNLNLPSANLSDFRRQSVGVQEVIEGQQTYTAFPYYERTRTVLRYPGLAAGLNIPGSNAPLPRPPIPAPAYGGSELEGAVLPAQPTEAGGTGQFRLSPDSPQAVAVPPAPNPEVFSSLTDRQRLDLSRELLELRRRQETAIIEQAQLPPAQQVQAQVAAQEGPNQQVTGEPVALPSPEPTPEQQQAAQQQAGQEQTARQEAARQQAQPNQDVFYDLMRRLDEQQAQQQAQQVQQQAQQDVRQGGQPAQPKVPPRPGMQDRTQPQQRGQQQDGQPGQDGRITQMLEEPRAPGLGEPPVGGMRQELPPSLVERVPQQGVVVHSLAGSSPDMVNYYLNRAAGLLKSGRYYDAAGDYEIAATLDSTNPLPQVGAGLALFAAGEPLSAAMRLRKAMEMYPPLIQTRMDVSGMVANDEMLEYRLNLLDKRIERADDEIRPLLVFVGTFMHYNLNHVTRASEMARRLDQFHDQSSVYAQYATLVIEAPASQPAPQPAP